MCLHQCVRWGTMDLLQILVLTLYITQAFTKTRSRKHKASSSDEGSIENLLYYKDCQRNSKPEVTPEVMPLKYSEPTPPPPKQPECPYPKMCCALTCGNECGGSQPPTSHMQSEPSNNIQRFHSMQNPANNNPPDMGGGPPKIIQRRKKKIRFPQNHMEGFMQSPLPSRRDFSGFTKEKIKGLIAQDDDIRKILKDLVRVTMQKVDLQDMINANQKNSYGDVNTVRSVLSTVHDMDDYVE